MAMRTSRRGYFFLFDAFLALGAIAFGIMLIASFRSYAPSQVQPLMLAEDVMATLAGNRVEDIANTTQTGLYVSGLVANGNITDAHNTLLEQAGEFYVRGNRALADDFTVNVTRQVVPPQYGLELHINGSDQVVVVSPGSVAMADSTVLVNAKRLVSGAVNASTMWGPLLMEVRVWA
ncbi:hypothetical protein J4439_02125 [Candidatus Woesearchaeota archaeon]|nr:hypothetical protein [Candidatus Woesearchaeota archaeon]